MKKTALLLIVVLILTVGCQPAPTPTPVPTPVPPTPTPGASGAPVVFIGKPESGSIEDMWVTADTDLSGSSAKTLPAVFPSSTAELFIVVKFSSLPSGVNLGVDVMGTKGIVQLDKEAKGKMLVTDKLVWFFALPVKPVSGKFADGPYQATVTFNSIPIALLNWTVGNVPR